MALPRFNWKPKKREQIVVIDLGTRTIKAVKLQRRGDAYQFAGYSILDAPASDSKPSTDLWAELFSKLIQPLGGHIRQVVIALGVNDALLRQAELPMLAVSDLRTMVKFNSKHYLQQELTDYVFDCCIMPPSPGAPPPEPSKAGAKCKVWVGGAKQSLLNSLQEAARKAGLTIEAIVPGLVAPGNAFEMAQPESFAKEVVVLADVGFKSSAVSILSQGEMMLNRVVGIGGDQLTNGLAEAMSISYAEAEGIKVGTPREVEAMLQSQIVPLGRELRASIDFFEHQHDQTVGHVFLSGGSARSDFIIQTLQSELMIPCQTWNATSFLELALPPQQLGEVEQVTAQLAVAVGAAVAVI